MANKTLIRSKKMHEVKLAEGGQLAQSQKSPEVTDQLPVPPAIRKGTSNKRGTAAPSPRTVSAGTRSTTARTKATLVADKAPTKSAKASPAARGAQSKASSPRLPAFVPANGLWEEDSVVMQRLQALMQRNAQLAEQLQRIQNNPLPKGREP